MRILLLGAGLQGIATALDLAWSKDVKEVLLADIDLNRAEFVADKCNRRYENKVRAVKCDVSDFDNLVELIKGWDLVINEVNYYYNCHVMEACLKAGVNYIDIGGLFTETRKQMNYHKRFVEAGLIAIPGIGGTPGLTNVAARWAVDKLDTVDEINIYCGSNDWTKTEESFSVSYAIETIMDEFKMKPVEYIDGKYVELEPESGKIEVVFSEPVGRQMEFHTIHSEIATLPEVFKSKGLRTCTFRVGFPQDTVDTFKFISDLGLASSDKILIKDQYIKPLDLLKRLMEMQPEDKNIEVNDCDIIKIEVKGVKEGRNIIYDLEAVCRPNKEWPELLGAQVYIGGAPSWAAQMLLNGEIKGTGVLPPEVCIPPKRLFEEAAKREIYMVANTKEILGFNDWNEVNRKKKVEQWK